ncbi:MAG: glucose-6-phosphate dehydrogenase [Algicola sp.]|nr:glucose-6-phosphate dehydrogenase [Algicola sp.]
MSQTTVDIVIFGGGGDLSLRKLMPALYRAHVNQELDKSIRIIATLRSVSNSADNGRDEFVNRIKQALQKHLQAQEFNPGHWQAFSERLCVVGLDIVDTNKGWPELSALLSLSDNTPLFYFALPPSVYGTACENLAEHNLIHPDARVVLEKPIGYDRESAEQINNKVGEYFPEANIYRIDHYLGKETVQNLMVLRFSNYLFEQLWDSKSIDHVQITLSETVGLEGRAGFYDNAGAVRDMVQNHLLQLLCLVAMEPASKLCAKEIRAEKIKVLNALRPLTGDDIKQNTVRGQYGFGVVSGCEQRGYLDELGNPTSTTETFVAIRAHIDNWRWAGVPFYLRTGKCLQQRYSEIVIQYKPVSHRVFCEDAGELCSNRLVVRLQPDENIQLELMTKDLERTDVHLQKMSLNLNEGSKQPSNIRDAYKRILLDAVRGDSTLFTHRDEVDASWKWLDPMLDYWQKSKDSPVEYSAGTWGPTEADQLLKKDGAIWRNPKNGEQSQ